MNEVKDFKNKLIKTIENGDIYHGIATLKQDLPLDNGKYIPNGTSGVITAWLADEAYAVLFDDRLFPGCWIKFDDLKTFEQFFDYELN